jgi:hypothetical protein
MVAVNMNDLSDAFEFVSAGDGIDMVEAYISLDTGKVYWVSDAVPEEEEIPDDVQTSDRYIEVPNKRELDLGQRLIFRFMKEHLPQQYDRVAEIFRRNGAYSRFKDLLASAGALDKWHAYEEKPKERALREWCEENGIGLVEAKANQQAG